MPLFDVLIKIDELPLQQFRQCASRRRLAAAHESCERNHHVLGSGITGLGLRTHRSEDVLPGWRRPRRRRARILASLLIAVFLAGIRILAGFHPAALQKATPSVEL